MFSGTRSKSVISVTGEVILTYWLLYKYKKNQVPAIQNELQEQLNLYAAGGSYGDK